jgi:ATP phosphoribosyltransferase regulatory subunit
MTPKATIRAQAERLFAAFQSAGAIPVDADILLPAETLLDLYGEDLRARAYVTHDPLAGEMMLRPDFTVPVVQAHMAHGADPARYTYLGEVFRRQEHLDGRPREYLQVGYEIFDRTAPEAADAEVFALIADLLADLPVTPVTGDMGLLMAAVAALDTTDRRKAALMRHIWRPHRFRALLDRFAGRVDPSPSRLALLQQAKGGIAPMIPDNVPGLRSADEIAERITALLADADAPPIPPQQVAILDRLLSLNAPLPMAVAALDDMALAMPALAPVATRFRSRMQALAARGVAVETLGFEAAHGRNTLEYYDGFVFEFHTADQRPVASGGRYDALTARLGQGRSIPAVGGVIRPALVAELRGAV